jgi:type IV secretion system protein VirB8
MWLNKFKQNLIDIKGKYAPQQDKDYFVDVDDWLKEKYICAQLWRDRCIALAAVTAILLFLALLSLTMLLPLKTNEPYLVFIKSDTGEPYTIYPAVSEDISQNENVKYYMLSKFIIARESFDNMNIDNDLDTVRVLGSKEVFNNYKDQLVRSNPNSPFNLYKNTTRNIQIKNIHFLNEERAIVFFTAYINGTTSSVIESLTADVSFKFANRQLSKEQANIINPVNFEVTAYRVQTAVEVIEEGDKV